MRISDWSSDVCSSDLGTAEIGDLAADRRLAVALRRHAPGLGFGLAALLALQPRLLLGIALEHGQRLGHVADLVLAPGIADLGRLARSEEHTSELQSLMSTSSAGFCLEQKNQHNKI